MMLLEVESLFAAEMYNYKMMSLSPVELILQVCAKNSIVVLTSRPSVQKYLLVCKVHSLQATATTTANKRSTNHKLATAC